MTTKEKLRLDLDVIRAMCENGALLSSECRAVPCTKKPATGPETVRRTDDNASGGVEAPDTGRGWLEA